MTKIAIHSVTVLLVGIILQIKDFPLCSGPPGTHSRSPGGPHFGKHPCGPCSVAEKFKHTTFSRYLASYRQEDMIGTNGCIKSSSFRRYQYRHSSFKTCFSAWLRSFAMFSFTLLFLHTLFWPLPLCSFHFSLFYLYPGFCVLSPCFLVKHFDLASQAAVRFTS